MRSIPTRSFPPTLASLAREKKLLPTSLRPVLLDLVFARLDDRQEPRSTPPPAGRRRYVGIPCSAASNRRVPLNGRLPLVRVNEKIMPQADAWVPVPTRRSRLPPFRKVRGDDSLGCHGSHSGLPPLKMTMLIRDGRRITDLYRTPTVVKRVMR